MASTRIFFRPDEHLMRRITRVRLTNSQITKPLESAVLELSDNAKDDVAIIGATREQWMKAKSAVITEKV
jgi:hypothetical protein